MLMEMACEVGPRVSRLWMLMPTTMTEKTTVQKVHRTFRNRSEWMWGSWLRISSMMPKKMMNSCSDTLPPGLYVWYTICAQASMSFRGSY